MPISTFPRHDYDEDEYLLKPAGLRDTHSEGKVTGRNVGHPSRYGVTCQYLQIVGVVFAVVFREQDQQQPWQVMATIDQADIRGSEPHNHDPSGAASD